MDKLEIIQQLMDQLKDEMSYGKDDFMVRLGKKDPDLAMIKIEGKMDPEMEGDEDKYGMDLDSDDEMGEDSDHRDMAMGEDDPDEMLKQRLMKLRS